MTFSQKKLKPILTRVMKTKNKQYQNVEVQTDKVNFPF